MIKYSSIHFQWIQLEYFTLSKNQNGPHSLLRKQRHLCGTLSCQMQVEMVCVHVVCGGRADASTLAISL